MIPYMAPTPARHISLGTQARLRPASVWALVAMTGAGGLMCLFAAIFPLSHDAPVGLDAIVGGVLLLESLTLVRFGTALRTWALHAIVVIAILTVSVLAASSATGQGVVVTAFGYLWICLYIGHFFPPRAVRAHAAVISASFGAALIITGLEAGVTIWVVVTTTVFVAGETLSRLSSKLRDEANTDPLTGLLNRNGLSRAAGRELSLADRTGVPLTVALIDLDGFKAVNDRGGHIAGDRMLKTLSDSWRAQIHQSDIFARYGGDEFVLVLPGTRLSQAQRLLDRLRLDSPIEWSAGVVAREPGEELGACLLRADAALYEAKRSHPERAEPEAGGAAGSPGRAVIADVPAAAD
jgi:diguanylate cyclase (GGDEF)-like protein